MTKFSRSFWLLIVVGAVLSSIAVAVASRVDNANASQFANYVAIGAVLVNLCGFLLVSEQLGATKDATENQTRWEIEQVSFNVYKMLVDEPSLRPYFYEGMPLPAPEPAQDHQQEAAGPAQLLRWKVDSACELLLDYFETIVRSGTVLDDTSEEVWHKYMVKIYRKSPALRAFLENERDRYTPELIELLDPPLGRRLREELAARRDMVIAPSPAYNPKQTER